MPGRHAGSHRNTDSVGRRRNGATPIGRTEAGNEPRQQVPFLRGVAAAVRRTFCAHLAGRSQDVTAIVADLDANRLPSGGFFMDLVARLVVVPEAVGREDVLSATRALRGLLAATADCYPHIDHAYGFSVQTAAAVACTMGRCNYALVLLARQSSPPAAPAVRRRHCHRARLPPAMQSEGAGHVVQQTHQRGITRAFNSSSSWQQRLHATLHALIQRAAAAQREMGAVGRGDWSDGHPTSRTQAAASGAPSHSLRAEVGIPYRRVDGARIDAAVNCRRPRAIRQQARALRAPARRMRLATHVLERVIARVGADLAHGVAGARSVMCVPMCRPIATVRRAASGGSARDVPAGPGGQPADRSRRATCRSAIPSSERRRSASQASPRHRRRDRRNRHPCCRPHHDRRSPGPVRRRHRLGPARTRAA